MGAVLHTSFLNRETATYSRINRNGFEEYLHFNLIFFCDE